MPLIASTNGDRLKIICLRGSEQTKQHLQNIGFCVGSHMQILSKNAGGIICKSESSTTSVALDLKTASKIEVVPAS